MDIQDMVMVNMEIRIQIEKYDVVLYALVAFLGDDSILYL